jgi:predicted DNA-binding transcriptional regulator YafY
MKKIKDYWMKLMNQINRKNIMINNLHNKIKTEEKNNYSLKKRFIQCNKELDKLKEEKNIADQFYKNRFESMKELNISIMAVLQIYNDQELTNKILSLMLKQLDIYDLRDQYDKAREKIVNK